MCVGGGGGGDEMNHRISKNKAKKRGTGQK